MNNEKLSLEEMIELAKKVENWKPAEYDQEQINKELEAGLFNPPKLLKGKLNTGGLEIHITFNKYVDGFYFFIKDVYNISGEVGNSFSLGNYEVKNKRGEENEISKAYDLAQRKFKEKMDLKYGIIKTKEQILDSLKFVVKNQ